MGKRRSRSERIFGTWKAELSVGLKLPSPLALHQQTRGRVCSSISPMLTIFRILDWSKKFDIGIQQHLARRPKTRTVVLRRVFFGECSLAAKVEQCQGVIPASRPRDRSASTVRARWIWHQKVASLSMYLPTSLRVWVSTISL